MGRNGGVFFVVVIVFVLFETGSCYVAQAALKLMFFLLQPSECWDYRHA
jgi:hypothetical protein